MKFELNWLKMLEKEENLSQLVLVKRTASLWESKISGLESKKDMREGYI